MQEEAERRLVITITNIGYPAYGAYATKITKKSLETQSRDQRQSPTSEYDENNGQRSSSESYEYKSVIDYKSNKININQVFTDFKNTVIAIGAPQDIHDEIESYLNLASIQAHKSKPSSTIIKSNLKNASMVLDDYISKTLNKNSKVVADWVDALLMQNIDYKASVDSDQIIQAGYTASSVSTDQVQNIQNTNANASDMMTVGQNLQINPEADTQIMQKNTKLLKLYSKCAKQTDSGNYDKALENYDKLLKIADKLDDKDIATKIHMDMGFIYDVNNNLPSALDHYYNAAVLSGQTGDLNTKAKAHYNMATIYDDIGEIDSAMIHYYCSLSYDGEVDNLDGQALSLNNIGNLYTAQYDHKTGLDYYKVAYSLLKETDDKTAQATVLSNVATVFNDLGYDDKALKFYKDAIKLDMQSGNVEGYAKNYDLAGDIMLKNGQIEKARNLYFRSMIAASEIGDNIWQSRMSEKIEHVEL